MGRAAKKAALSSRPMISCPRNLAYGIDHDRHLSKCSLSQKPGHKPQAINPQQQQQRTKMDNDQINSLRSQASEYVQQCESTAKQIDVAEAVLKLLYATRELQAAIGEPLLEQLKEADAAVDAPSSVAGHERRDETVLA